MINYKKGVFKRGVVMFGLILAGGSGSRLWPLSRELYPKQLINIQNTESLLQATFERIKECMPEENIIIRLIEHMFYNMAIRRGYGNFSAHRYE